MVAQGYSQKEGIDYNEVFSPVKKYIFVRILLAIVTPFDIHFEQMDVKISFLHMELDETIFMRQSRGLKLKERKTNYSYLRSHFIG